jgi:hypothetical protein
MTKPLSGSRPDDSVEQDSLCSPGRKTTAQITRIVTPRHRFVASKNGGQLPLFWANKAQRRPLSRECRSALFFGNNFDR